MPDLSARLRQDFTDALRKRDRNVVRVLRTVMSAISNAEAQPAQEPTPASLRTEGVIAGAAVGVGAAEVDRRELDEQQVRAIVEAERRERLDAAADLAARGAREVAAKLLAEGALLDRYLD